MLHGQARLLQNEVSEPGIRPAPRVVAPSLQDIDRSFRFLEPIDGLMCHEIVEEGEFELVGEYRCPAARVECLQVAEQDPSGAMWRMRAIIVRKDLEDYLEYHKGKRKARIFRFQQPKRYRMAA